MADNRAAAISAQRAQDGFRTFAVDPPYAVQTLRTRLNQLIKEAATELAGGYAKDFPDYRFRCGNIEGLTAALRICDDIEKKERQ